MATVDFAAYVTCEPNECKDCDLLRALIHRLERYEKALWYIVRRGYTGAEYVAREALKEETDSVG